MTPVQSASIVRARGELAAAEGHVDEAVHFLRDALRQWRELDALIEVAPLHERLAELLRGAGDTVAAAFELEAAEAVWRDAGAVVRAEACAARPSRSS